MTEETHDTESKSAKTRASGNAARELDEVTDESTAIIQAKSTSQRRYHRNADGKPACRMRSTYDPAVWDLDLARTWARPCQYCFPEGDEE